MSDFGDMSYDMDDPDMLYDPFGGETRPRIDQDGGLDVSDDVVESEGGPGPDQTRQNSSLDWELEYLDKSIIYLNLQVTQSILHPKELRRTKSGDIDCFRWVADLPLKGSALLTSCEVF
ncbi:hypothetical protein FRC20_007006 [Serendipita sp. 405]|nr:hypothetical protein FRC20_007006 [Serendipita sp. 405]